MRVVPGALGVLLLLGLLTWLLLRGIDTNAPSYAVMLRAFDDFALAEASLHRDVLQARAGLLRDYDTLVKAGQAMEDAANRLRSHALTEGLDAGPVDRLDAAVAQQEELTESFKSSNSLLQNSLSYVGLLSTSPEFGAQDSHLALRGGCFGSSRPIPNARHVTGRGQGAARTDRPICGASANFRARCGSSTGATYAYPSIARSPACDRRNAKGPHYRA